jgi:hypothetical protein
LPFEGVIVTRFDMLLGPAPALVYPQKFVSGEGLREIAEDAMLLLATARKEAVCSIMSFFDVGKVGVVGSEGSSAEGAIGIIIMFDKAAKGLIWESYPLIRSLIVSELPNVRRHPEDASLRLFEGVRRICEKSHEEEALQEPADNLEAVVDKTLLAINTFVESGNLDRLESVAPGIKSRFAPLKEALDKSKTQLRF